MVFVLDVMFYLIVNCVLINKLAMFALIITLLQKATAKFVIILFLNVNNVIINKNVGDVKMVFILMNNMYAVHAQ